MKTVLKNGNILSMKSDTIKYFCDLIFEDGRIAEIGKRLPVPEGAQVIDCTGKYIMPSLFDAHTHLDTCEQPYLFLANGITAVRHLSGNPKVLEYDEQVRAGERRGPYLYSSSPIYDGEAAVDRTNMHIYISTVEQAEQAVYDTINGGYNEIKLYPSLTTAQFAMILDTARKCGLKVSGHMSHQTEAKFLCDHGYRSCEHSSSLPKHLEDCRYLARNGMWLCQTQVVCETLPDYVWKGKKLSDLEFYAYLPDPLKESWEEENRTIIEMYKRPDMARVASSAPGGTNPLMRGLAFMECSDRYMAGCDAGYPGVISGFSLHDELSRLVELYKATPYEALRAATVNPAAYLELDTKGTLAPGMDADILVLTANPLADIRSSRSIDCVIQGGRIYARAELDEMLEYVRTMPREEFSYINRPRERSKKED